jgi:hypothetical protein|tara:strand:+ start:5612 stop:5803 length:192 start_codon:yes stop_codon:yes gene_type:complete
MEAISFNYWILIVKMLKEGIPWELLRDASYEDMIQMLGVVSAFSQIEDDEQRRQEAQQRNMRF